jgi:hypothetical protein
MGPIVCELDGPGTTFAEFLEHNQRRTLFLLNDMEVRR